MILGKLSELVRRILDWLARDTLNGFVAYIVPGQDAYSCAQGTPREEPGGIEAGGTDSLIENLDRFLPVPDVLRPACFRCENAETIPLSLPIALALDCIAILVNPVARCGVFLSPFARLSFADKARAMAIPETSLPRLIARFDTRLPEPFKASVSGLLQFLGGALHELAAFGSFGESQCLDPVTRSLTCRPVGWQLTGFYPTTSPAMAGTTSWAITRAGRR